MIYNNYFSNDNFYMSNGGGRWASRSLDLIEVREFFYNNFICAKSYLPFHNAYGLHMNIKILKCDFHPLLWVVGTGLDKKKLCTFTIVHFLFIVHYFYYYYILCLTKEIGS